jgi:hypothetical protein
MDRQYVEGATDLIGERLPALVQRTALFTKPEPKGEFFHVVVFVSVFVPLFALRETPNFGKLYEYSLN